MFQNAKCVHFEGLFFILRPYDLPTFSGIEILFLSCKEDKGGEGSSVGRFLHTAK